MKYTITNDRLREFMNNYLDDRLSGGVSRVDSFIIVYAEDDYDTYDYDGIVFEYDSSDDRLYIYKEFLLKFSAMFPLDVEDSVEFMKEWFEKKFDVKIKYTAF